MLTALFLSQIEIIFQLVGAIPTTYLIFILPSLGIIKYHQYAPDYISAWLFRAAIALIVVGIIIAVGSTVITIMDMMNG